MGIVIKHGLYEERYDNNELKSQVNFVNGIISGTTKHYYDTWQLKTEVVYVDGIIDGVYKNTMMMVS